MTAPPPDAPPPARAPPPATGPARPSLLPVDPTVQVNMMSALLDAQKPIDVRQTRWLVLFGEAALIAGVGLVLSRAIGLPQSGMFAIFFMAAGLTDRLNQLLQENKADVYRHRRPPWRVNAKTIASLIVMFAGLFVACTGATLLWGEASLRQSFAFALDFAQLGDTSLLERRFGSFSGLVAHNLVVLGTFSLLSVVYRSFGALLALSWNACVWAMVLTLLIWRGAPESSLPTVVWIAGAAVAVLPHLTLEVLAYVVASLGAIFFSKAVTRYNPTDKRFRVVTRTALTMAALGVGLVCAAAAVESTLPALVTRALR